MRIHGQRSLEGAAVGELVPAKLIASSSAICLLRRAAARALLCCRSPLARPARLVLEEGLLIPRDETDEDEKGKVAERQQGRRVKKRARVEGVAVRCEPVEVESRVS